MHMLRMINTLLQMSLNWKTRLFRGLKTKYTSYCKPQLVAELHCML